MRKMLLLIMGMLFLSGHLLAQNKTVTGRVTDEKGNPVAGANVVAKGTKAGASTTPDGSFSINVPSTAKTLIISSVGFGTQEAAIGPNGTVSVILSTEGKGLQEVVVVGYGTQKKSDMTASVAKVGGDKVADVPFSSVDQILQGKAAGMQSVTFSGQPGANQQIRIRGISSYTASAQPLFVIDGIQINSGDLSRLTTSSNVLANINPDDIESVSILKDAAATAIYGSRGGNGVIIITTKRGKSGKTQLKVSAEVGNNKVGDMPPSAKPLNSSQWLGLFKEAIVNAGFSQATADATAATYGDGSVDTHWFDVVTRSGKQQQYNMSAAGGDEKTKFYISGGYFKQEAATIGADLSRISSIINIDHTVSKKLNLSLNLQPSFTTEHAPLSNGSQFGNPILDVFFLRPTQNPYNADGTLNISRASKDFSQIYNPLYIAANDQHNYGTFQGIGSAQARYNILDNLHFTTKMGLQYSSLEEYQYNNPYHGDGLAQNGRGYAYYTRYFLYDWTNQLDYHLNINKAKTLTADARLGYEAISSKGYFINAAAQNFPPRLIESTVAATVTDGKANGSDYTFNSIYSSLSINYLGKYILTGNYRRDGSSRFSASNKYGNFPAASFAWYVSKENFFNNINFVNDFKIRASYGSSGNAEIGNYPWQTLEVYGGGANYNNQPGGTFSSLGNPTLTWEKTNQLDLGFDAAIWKNRISLVFDYYDKNTSALLFSVPLSQTTGFGGLLTNLGKLENKGIEITINATPVTTKDFNWDLSFNFTHNKNTIKTIPAGQTQIAYGTGLVLKPGMDIQTFYLRQWAGVDPATGNPLWFTDDTKGTTTTNYNAAARSFNVGSASPKFYGGFSNTFTYKFISVSGDFYYNYGNKVYDSWYFYLADWVQPSFGKYQLDLQRWQKPGDITNVPKAVYGSTNFSTSGSTRMLYKGDYIRLRNLTVSYNMTPSLLKKVHLNSFKFYVRGTNLWTKTYDKNLTIDPEVGVAGASNLNIFYNKSLTAGVNIGF